MVPQTVASSGLPGRRVSGIVEETRYVDLFDRYVTHVSYWVKGEHLRNPVTGAYEEPDRALFAEVERRVARLQNRR
jgi:predicted Ser/Thr protein kinase